MTTLCANHSQQLVAVFLLTALAFAGCVQPQLQHAQHSQRSVLNEPTPYPAAGYRPKIPFHLPRNPKVLFPTSTSTSMTTATTTTATTYKMPFSMAPTEQIDINIETLDETTTVISVPRIPANGYGTPSGTVQDMDVNVDLLYETDVINAPTEHFQPPMPNAAKNFNNTLDYDEEILTTRHHDTLLTNDDDDLHKNNDNVGQVVVAATAVEPLPKLNVFNKRFEFEQRHQIPDSTYGPTNPMVANMYTNPNTNTNKVPIGTFELELNESENELLPHTNTDTKSNRYTYIHTYINGNM